MPGVRTGRVYEQGPEAAEGGSEGGGGVLDWVDSGGSQVQREAM